MNRKQIPALGSIGVLLVLIIAGLQKAFTDLYLYGWTYSVMTIVAGVESSSVVSVAFEFVTVGVFFWFLLLAGLNFWLLRNRKRDPFAD